MSDNFSDIKALAHYDSQGDTSANRLEPKKPQGSEQSDIVEMIHDRMKSAKTGVLDWREDAEVCDRFKASHQWDNDDLELLRDQNRPAITFNRIHPIVEVVAGTEIANRQEVRFVPRHPEMQQKGAIADLATDAFQWANDLCFADDERSFAFKDLLVRGMGWAEQTLDYDTNLDGQYSFIRFDGMEAWWDTSSRGQNLFDTKWRGRKKWWPVKEIMSTWEDAKEELREASLGGSPGIVDNDDDFPINIETVTPIHYKENNQTVLPGRPRGHWPVVQHQWYDMETIYRVVDPQDPEGALKEYSEKQFKQLEENLKKHRVPNNLNYVKQKKRVYWEAFVTRGVLLEKKKLAIQDGFTLKCMTGYWDPKKKVWYGLVRAMIEPQRAANKWLSQGLHIVNANAKGGLMVETDAVTNVRRFEDEWAMPDKISWLKPGALSGERGAKIKEKAVPNFPPAIVTMIQYAIESLRDVTGVSIEMLGFSEGNTPGVSQRQRQQQGMTILAGLFLSLTRFRKEEAISAMSFIRDYIADGRLIRVGGEYNAQAVQLLKDPLSLEYDLVIDESPRNPNVKMEVWGGLTQIMPILLKMGMFPPELLDYTPMPASLTSKLKETLMKSQQHASQIPPKGYVDPREREARIEGLKAKAMLDVERARMLDKEADFKKVELLLQTMLEGQQAQQPQQQDGPTPQDTGQHIDNLKSLFMKDIQLGGVGGGAEGVGDGRTPA